VSTGVDPGRPGDRGRRCARHLGFCRLARPGHRRLGRDRLGGLEVSTLGRDRLVGGLGVGGLEEGLLYRHRTPPREQLADHRLGHPEPVSDHLLGPSLRRPYPGLHHLLVGELGRAAPGTHQSGRSLRPGPPPQDRHVGRGEPEHPRDLVDPPADVGQRHDRQVAHPDVVGVIAVDQRTPACHHSLPIAGHQAQHTRFRHPRQLSLTQAHSVLHLNGIPMISDKEKALVTGHPHRLLQEV